MTRKSNVVEKEEFVGTETAPVEEPRPSLTDDLAVEALPDLSDVADEPSIPFKGWARAKTLEGYSTRAGKQRNTEDVPSQDGASRNLRVCFAVSTGRGNEVINLQAQFNYRANDFSPERVAFIKEVRKDMAGVEHWPDKDAQRTSLSLAKIGQFQAAGASLNLVKGAGFAVAGLFDQEFDVYVGTDKNGYSTINQYAKAGSAVRIRR